MEKEQLEEIILKKLSDGSLDGPVGGTCITPSIFCRRFIKNGVPQYISAKLEPQEVTHQKFETREEKLQFLVSAGWMMDDPDVNLYCELYRVPLKKRTHQKAASTGDEKPDQ